MPFLSTLDLFDALAARYRETAAQVELIDGLDPVINLRLGDVGDMDIQVVASGSQILVSTVLAPVARVRDPAGLNEACLRLNPLNPLSNLGIASYPGGDAYIVFGELSSSSSVDQIDEEIQVLAQNTVDAANALQSFFR